MKENQTPEQHGAIVSKLIGTTRLHQIPLHTRLILAFATLIVISALATMVIGGAVLGNKVEELTRSKVTLYVKVAKQVLNLQMERMRLLTQQIVSRIDHDELPAHLVESAFQEVPVDFVIYFNKDRVMVMRRSDGHVAERSASRLTKVELSGERGESIRGSDLARLARSGVGSNTASVGLLTISKKTLEAIGLVAPSNELMVMFAAVPVNDSTDAVLLGGVLNGRNMLLQETENIIAPLKPEVVVTTIFLNDIRIASTLGDKAIGSRADNKVAQAVIIRHEVFSGKAKVLRGLLFTAYMPLFDFKAKVIGMLGAGTNEDIYKETKRKTTMLFSALIVGGMLFGLIITYFFSRWLVKPVAQLAKGMSRVAEGDFSYKVRLTSGDELGKLAQAFNRMVKAVKERDFKLREMTENRLSAVEKQISIGRLAAGVAHEINNPLTAILSLSILMQQTIPENDVRREDLDIIVSETKRCREIVRGLLDFARESPANRTVVDINQVARDTIMLASKYDAMVKAKVVIDLSSTPLYVSADSKMLQQVLTNLLLNAAEALNETGTITIKTDEDSSGGFVQLQVVDTGKGIPKEHIDRVFEPFFTTRGMGRGTGLGLSVSLGIIQKHEGTIEIKSEEGKGTAVTVILPRV